MLSRRVHFAQSMEVLVRMKFIPYVLLVALTIIPSLALLKRTGMSKAWALLSLAPLGMLVILWLIAYRAWPRLEASNA